MKKMNKNNGQWENKKHGDLVDIQPVNDLRTHKKIGCWCDPDIELVEGGILQIHHSLDGREKYETGERSLN